MESLPEAFVAERRRRVRRSAIFFALVAAAFYVGFIVMMVERGSK